MDMWGVARKQRSMCSGASICPCQGLASERTDVRKAISSPVATTTGIVNGGNLA